MIDESYYKIDTTATTDYWSKYYQCPTVDVPGEFVKFKVIEETSSDAPTIKFLRWVVEMNELLYVQDYWRHGDD